MMKTHLNTLLINWWIIGSIHGCLLEIFSVIIILTVMSAMLFAFINVYKKLIWLPNYRFISNDTYKLLSESLVGILFLNPWVYVFF